LIPSVRLEDLSKREDDMNERLVAIEARYRAQFAALDAMITGLNSTSTFLTQQLANLPKINGTSSN
jgi:flagellar hook-associated protein 2